MSEGILFEHAKFLTLANEIGFIKKTGPLAEVALHPLRMESPLAVQLQTADRQLSMPVSCRD